METREKLSNQLLLAISDNDERAVRELVTKGASVDQLSPEGDTPLMAACRAGLGSLVRYLVQDVHVNMDVQGHGPGESWTALMFAGFYGHTAIVRFLVEMGADYTLRNADAQTVLEIEPCGRASLMEIQENVALGVQNRSEASSVHTFHFYQPATANNKSTDNASRKASQSSEPFSRTSFGASVLSAPSRSIIHSNPEQASVTAELWSSQEKEGGAVAVWRQNQPIITERMDIVSARPHIIHLYRNLCEDFGSPIDARIELAINDTSADIPEAGLGALNLRTAHLQYTKVSGAPPLPEHHRRAARERASRAVKVGDLHILPLLEVLSHAMPHAPFHTLDLSFSEISDVSIKALATWLLHTDTLTVLNLEGNYITAKGAEMLASALPKQRSLRQLSLSRNPIGMAGASAICDALMSNDSLVSLDIADTDAGAVGCMRAAALLHSQTLPLVRLNLDGACRGEEAASVVPHLARGLSSSRLQALSLAHWGLRSEHTQWIAQSLQQNRSLTELNLRANAVDSTGTAVLAMAMRLRKDACFVNLDGNPLRDQLLDEVYAVCDAEANEEALDHFSPVAGRPAFACTCEFSTGEPLDEEVADRYSDLRHCLISRVVE